MAAMKLIVICALAMAVDSVPINQGIGIGAGIYPGGIGFGIGSMGGLGFGGLGYGGLGYGGGMGGGMFPGYGLMGYKDKDKDGAKNDNAETKPAGPIKLEPHSEIAANSNPAAAVVNPVSGLAGAALNTVTGAAATAARVAAAPVELAAGAAGAVANTAGNLLKTIL